MEDSEIQHHIEESINQIKKRLVDNLTFIFLWKDNIGKNEF